MEKEISFKTVTLDVVKEVIQSPVVVGKYRGLEVKEVLDNYTHELNSNSLLLIDLRKANPLDYIFCQYAFGPMLKMLQQKNSDFKLLLFQMHEHHKSCFFRGILKYINKDLPRSKSIEAFIDANLFTMIKVEELDEIQYISKLNAVELEILNYINEAKSISGRYIMEQKTTIPFESISSALHTLNEKGYIVHIKNEDDNYHSIYNYL